MLKVFITYALPEQQWIHELEIPLGSTVRDVLLAGQHFLPLSDTDLSQHKVGIYDQVVDWERQVQEGDRIEIYRPLIVDPMTARRLRAQHRASEK